MGFGINNLLITPTYTKHTTEKRKIPILEVHLEEVLDGLDFTMDEFVDLCILCGCDYVDSIRGIGFKTAFKLMKKHRCLEKVFFFLFFFLSFFLSLSYHSLILSLHTHRSLRALIKKNIRFLLSLKIVWKTFESCSKILMLSQLRNVMYAPLYLFIIYFILFYFNLSFRNHLLPPPFHFNNLNFFFFSSQMQYKECDEEGIVEFLCGEKNFNEVNHNIDILLIKSFFISLLIL